MILNKIFANDFNGCLDCINARFDLCYMSLSWASGGLERYLVS